MFAATSCTREEVTVPSGQSIVVIEASGVSSADVKNCKVSSLHAFLLTLVDSCAVVPAREFRDEHGFHKYCNLCVIC